MRLGDTDETGWITPPPGQKYLDLFYEVEWSYDLPDDLLSRMAYQETGGTYNPKKRNVFSGAAGMFQFMPATAKALKIDPYNVTQAAWAAGKYIAYLYKKFGSWQLALAAYNWGPGNVQKKGLAKAPRETRNYYGSITSDLGLA